MLCVLRPLSRWGRAPALLAGAAIATLSVLWWWFTERQGQGDLRAFESYLVVTGFDFGQLGPGVTARDWLSDVVLLIASSV